MLVQSNCSDDPAIWILLAMSILNPTMERLDALCAQYHSAPSWTLFGYRLNDMLIGCLGIQVIAADSAAIKHIAVLSSAQRRGVGRHMIEQLQKQYGFHHLKAETDHDAVGFYRRCGFSIESLGELYPGTERFGCEIGATTNEVEGR